MPINTNLNTAPYYDDFDEDDNFHRVLFRPGFALQARELTQLQSILQNQNETHGKHTFADGAMVIPGHQIYDNKYQAVRLSGTFGGEPINVAQFYNADNPSESVTFHIKKPLPFQSVSGEYEKIPVDESSVASPFKS